MYLLQGADIRLCLHSPRRRNSGTSSGFQRKYWRDGAEFSCSLTKVHAIMERRLMRSWKLINTPSNWSFFRHIRPNWTRRSNVGNQGENGYQIALSPLWQQWSINSRSSSTNLLLCPKCSIIYLISYNRGFVAKDDAGRERLAMMVADESHPMEGLAKWLAKNKRDIDGTSCQTVSRGFLDA